MRFIFICFILCLTSTYFTKAQDVEKYGSDKDLCLRNYSLYKGYFQNNDYSDAKMFWNKLIGICPAYSTGIWSDGEKIFKAEISEENDPIKKVQLIDSLMWVYDQRIAYFGNHPRFTKGYLLGKKGIALINYQVQPTSRAYNALKEAIEIESYKSNPAVILTFMKVTKSQFQGGIIDATDVIDNYNTCMEILDTNLSKTPNDKDLNTAKNGTEHYLVSSKAADCSTLVEIYSKQFDEKANDAEWLTKITNLLKSTACKDTKLYSESTEALFVLRPSAQSAHKIANMHFTNGDYEKAIYYLSKGVEIGDELEQKASMYYELAYLHYTQLKDYQTARMYARKAIELRPNWGDPYILIGKMYIDNRQSVSEKSFEQEAVFWAAVDKFITAKKVDPEQTKKANDLIKHYSQLFPINEDVFMWTLEEGNTYEVRGWIKEKTTVRSRKMD